MPIIGSCMNVFKYYCYSHRRPNVGVLFQYNRVLCKTRRLLRHSHWPENDDIKTRTEKRAKIRWQMNKLFETEIVTHWMAAIKSWKLIWIVNWNDWNTGNWACDALTKTWFLDDEKPQENQIFRDLRHLTFQVSVNMWYNMHLLNWNNIIYSNLARILRE
jgi:hypothetical protein